MHRYAIQYSLFVSYITVQLLHLSNVIVDEMSKSEQPAPWRRSAVECVFSRQKVLSRIRTHAPFRFVFFCFLFYLYSFFVNQHFFVCFTPCKHWHIVQVVDVGFFSYIQLVIFAGPPFVVMCFLLSRFCPYWLFSFRSFSIYWKFLLTNRFVSENEYFFVKIHLLQSSVGIL